MGNILLSIAIPTYNRAPLLRLCLEQILKQAEPYKNELEVLVSDNDSTDDTEQVVKNIITHGLNIIYVKNHENIGAERNVVQCFEKAIGKYVLILGDDDLILDSGLRRIIAFLRENEVGVLYLTSYGFKDDFVAELPKHKRTGTEVFNDIGNFLKKVNYWITFISGNVVNKSLMRSEFDASRFIGTNLPQLNWILNAAILEERNAILHDHVIAAKSENTGCYSICEIFGVNFNAIINEILTESKYNHVIKHINNLLLRQFFPGFILNIRKRRIGYNFEDRDFQGVLKPLYSSYMNYWLYLAPVIKLPLFIATRWHFALRIINKIEREFFL